MTYICLKTFSCAQLMEIKYNLQLEVIHGFVSLSFWRLKYDWFHSDCFESCDTGCILLEIIQAVLSLVGSGKMFVMVILNQTVFASFWFKPDQASEFSFVLYTNVMHFLYSIVGRYRKKFPIIFQERSQPMGRSKWWTAFLALLEVEYLVNVRKVHFRLN